MTDDIRMIDDAGRPTVCRNHPASNEVEMLDADGRPRIKFVLNEVATLEGQALKLGGRVYQVSESGSTAEEVAQWVSRVRQRCPVDSGRKPGGSPIALVVRPASDHQRQEVRGAARSLVTLAEVVGALLVVVGVLGIIGGIVIALKTEDIGTGFAIQQSREHITLGVALALASVVEIGVMLVLVRLASVVGQYVDMRASG